MRPFSGNCVSGTRRSECDLFFSCWVVLLIACGSERSPVECQDNNNCNLDPGGKCEVNPATGNQWCTYPDSECESGRRWSDFDTGDDLSGTCQQDYVADAAPPDAFSAIDGAPSADANGLVGVSCSGLSNACGAAGNDSCCASTFVPGGTYYRSYDAAIDDWNDAGNPATVGDFQLDTYEITVGRFRRFVEAGMGTQQNPPDDGSGAHPTIAQTGWNAARWGQADLAGNVWEWVFDGWNISYTNPCNNCVNSDDSGGRAYRGGSYSSSAAEVRTSARHGFPGNLRAKNLGARCARTP